MRFADALDLYFDDMWAEGRITSTRTERDYRIVLHAHADDVGNRDPRYTNRDDVNGTLRRWRHPNSRRKNRSVLMAFYRWTVQEGYRKDNPVEQTRPSRQIPPDTRRLTRDEVVRLLDAAASERERRALFLGVFAGLRNSELRGLQGRHFERPGLIWVSPDIAKGPTGREVPVAPELEGIVARIKAAVGTDEFVLPHQQWADPGTNERQVDVPSRASSSQALRKLMRDVAKRAGIKGRVYPHQMRHAFAELMVRHAGARITQAMLGHADARTTETYTGKPSFDDLAAHMAGFKIGVLIERTFYPPAIDLANPVEAPTGIEPV
jgi:integrase/recombinase XerD